ncbi:MAG TPA: methyltransferase domain-containing protein [Anaerolineae bacterium]|jgi:SAM-dependent methyltransferase|nr:methyltransferase domain-containing protein [Anaerolineae bacterium]
MWLLVLGLILVVVAAISISWTHFRGAQWAPTTMKTANKMLAIADVGPDDLVYDLGCGDGRIIVSAARRYGARAVGIEIDPFRYLWCQVLIAVLGLRGRVKVIFGDFFNQDLSDADVVTCYLLQVTNEKLEAKLKEDLRPGTRVVSNYFTFPGLVKVRESGDARLYLCNLGQ